MNARAIVHKLLEGEPPIGNPGGMNEPEQFDAKAYLLSTPRWPNETELQALDRYRRGVRAYIKWIDKRDPEAGYWPDHRADLLALRRCKTFDEVSAVLAKYDSPYPLNFLSLIQQGYFV